MKKETRRWVEKAEEDYNGALNLEKLKARYHDLVCFHCQQAAEKYLKAFMEERSVPIPKTHNLHELLMRLLPHDASLKSLRRGLLTLSRFAVEYRYPGENATKRDAQSSLRKAERIRRELRKRLGLRTPP